MTRLRRWWDGLERRDRITFAGLGALLAFGTALRAAIMVAAPPAFLGYPDSYYYIGAAAGSLFSDPGHPAGYAVFLRALHTLHPHLLTMVAVQHLLGLATGALLCLTLRRAGVRDWPSLLPAAVVLLTGPMLWLEHAPMGEALFVFLQAAALYATVRAADARTVSWAAAAGALALLGVLVRPVGLVTLVAVVAWLAAMTPGPRMRRAVRASAAALVVIPLLGGYFAVQRHLTGETELVPASGWHIYARAATFADCDRFDPPEGTAHLCQHSDPSARPGPNDYIFDSRSPAVRAYGGPHKAGPEASDILGRFGRAAIVNQPFDWLEQVIREELPRYVWSRRVIREDQGMDYGLLASALRAPTDADMARRVRDYYEDAPDVGHSPDPGPIRTYERWTRVDGFLSVLVMLLAVAGVALARGRERAVAVLLAGVAVGGMVASALTLFYDARYALAALGPLAGAAGIGVAAAAERVRARRETSA